MNSLLSPLSILLFTCVSAQNPAPTTIPVNEVDLSPPNTARYHEPTPPPLQDTLRPHAHSTYYHQRRSLFESLPNGLDEIILLGDSMTDGCEWSELLNNPNVKNRGISGDITLGVLDRLNEVTASQPKQVFLLIGTNDLSLGYPPHSVINNISRIVNRINTDSPSTKVYVQTITPVNDHYGKFNQHTCNGKQIEILNTTLRAGIPGQYELIDLYPAFQDQQGKLDTLLSNDGLHLNGAGYRVWADILKTYL